MDVLVVEDDRRMAEVLKKGLVEDGHQVALSHRGDEGCEMLAVRPFDVVVLDVMLPGMDGFSILKHARTTRHSMPILMLTARDSMADIVRGLDLGADDYLTKPFHLEIFLAHVRAIGRRGPVPQQPQLVVGDLVMNRSGQTLRRGDKPIVLMRKEYAILELLMRRANQVVTRTQLIEAAWGHDAEIRDNTFDVYMHSLRSKIDRDGELSVIRTVRSLGYLLASPE